MSYHINTKCIYGDNESRKKERTGSISYPIYQTATYAHPGVGESTGYDNETLLRLSVGIEHIDDLIKDLAQALED